MAEEIIISYKVDTTGLDKAVVAVDKVTEATGDLQQKIKVAFTQKELDAAVQKLEDMGMSVDALVLKYGSAQKAFKGATKELIDMAAAGQQGTKEFKDLEKSAAQLQDTIGDTRNSIKRLSSDTRLIDSMAQGMRGLAAAGSVAAGVMATFGSENQQLQKTLLQVQGAMATLQGVQELANIATEKGGIATKAYGLALQGVDKISKLTGASMAASWALATAGITVVVGAIIGLIYYLSQAEEDTTALTESQQKNADEIDNLKLKYEEATGAIDGYTRATKELSKETEKSLAALNKTIEKEVNDAQTTIGQSFLNILESYGIRAMDGEKRRADIKLSIDKKYAKDREQIEEAAKIRQGILDANEEKRKAEELKRANEERLKLMMDARKKEIDAIEKQFKDLNVPKEKWYSELEGAVSGGQAVIDKLPPVTVKVELDKKTLEDNLIEFGQQYAQYQKIAEAAVSSISAITDSIYSNETLQLEAEKNRQLAIVGDNTKKREEIEKQFAIKSAQIARKQAEANKAIALVNIALSTAQAIAKATEKGFPAAYADIAIATAQGIIQAGIVIAQPLPEVPSFEKGGEVLAGGTKRDGHLYGRSHKEGGILINAQGGEYIWDIPTVKKHGDIIRAAHENRLDDLILHQYVAPLLQQSLAATSAHSEYDDFMLRATIKQGHEKDRRNAEYIADKVSAAVTTSMFNKNRYQ